MSTTNSYISSVIIGCLLYLIILGLYTSRKVSGNNSLYFYTSGSASWKDLALSFFTLNFPGEFFLIIVLLTITIRQINDFYSLFLLIILSFSVYYFFPILLRSKFLSFQHSINKLFSRNEKFVISLITILTSVLFRLTLILTTAGVLLFDLLGLSYTTFILMMIIAAGIYSVTGGLASMVNLQLSQVILILITVLLITGLALGEGFMNVSAESSAVYKQSELLKILAQVNWYETILFIPVLCLWLWYTELGISQKISAPHENNEKGLAYSRLLRIVLIIFFILTALIVNYYSPQESLDQLFSSFMNNQNVYLIVRIIAVFTLFSALIMVLSSVFISASVQLTKDFLEPIYGTSNNGKLILISRFSISLLVLITIFLIPFSDLNSIRLYLSILRYYVLVLAPISAFFMIVLLYKKTTSRGVFAGITIGEAIVVITIAAELFFSENPDSLSLGPNSIPVLQQAVIIFSLSSVTMVLVSNIRSVKQIQLNHLFKKI